MTENTKRIVVALILAAVIIGATFLLKSLSADGVISSDLSKRLIQGLIGVILIISGNSIPKTLEPLYARCKNPSREQRFKRLAGWTFVISGALYTIIWLTVPLQYAGAISISVVVIALLMVVIPMFRMYLRRSKTTNAGL